MSKFEIFKILSTLNFGIIIFFIPFHFTSYYLILGILAHFSSFYNLFVGLLHNSFDPSFFFYFYGLMLITYNN